MVTTVSSICGARAKGQDQKCSPTRASCGSVKLWSQVHQDERLRWLRCPMRLHYCGVTMMMGKVWFLGHNMSVGEMNQTSRTSQFSCSMGVSCPCCAVISGVSWLLGDRIMLCNRLSLPISVAPAVWSEAMASREYAAGGSTY